MAASLINFDKGELNALIASEKSIMKVVSRMTNKKVRLVKTKNDYKVNSKTAPEFMLVYQKAVLLMLKEQSTINDLQCQMCIDKLTEGHRKSAHSQNTDGNDMLTLSQKKGM